MPNVISISDISSLPSMLKEDIVSAVNAEIKSVCEATLRKYVMNDVYSGGGGSGMYHRTYQFANAVEVMDISSSGSMVSFRITINASKMGTIAPSGQEWGKHEGMKNEDFREGLISTLDEGSSGSPFYNFSGAHFFDHAASELDSKLVGILAGALRGRGWDAHVM